MKFLTALLLTILSKFKKDIVKEDDDWSPKLKDDDFT